MDSNALNRFTSAAIWSFLGGVALVLGALTIAAR